MLILFIYTFATRSLPPATLFDEFGRANYRSSTQNGTMISLIETFNWHIQFGPEFSLCFDTIYSETQACQVRKAMCLSPIIQPPQVYVSETRSPIPETYGAEHSNAHDPYSTGIGLIIVSMPRCHLSFRRHNLTNLVEHLLPKPPTVALQTEKHSPPPGIRHRS
jgi:hypothetical protein